MARSSSSSSHRQRQQSKRKSVIIMKFIIPNNNPLLFVISTIFFFESLFTLVQASRCTLCGNQVIPKEAMGIFLHNNGNSADEDSTDSEEENALSCQQLLNRLSSNNIMDFSEDCRQIQLAAFQIGCCGSDGSFVPRNSCAICPDLSPFDPSIPVPHAKPPRTSSTSTRIDDNGDISITNSQSDSIPQQQQTTTQLTCGDLPDLPSFLDYFTTPGDCSDTYLQRSAGWCGCPGREIECSICPNGYDMIDPTKTEKVLYGWDCSTFEYVTALLSSEECPRRSTILEFDASAFCCSHVVESPNVCNFCPSTQRLGRRDKEILTDYGMLTCGDIDDSLSLIPTEESCSFARSKFNSELCCEYDISSSDSSSNPSEVRGRNKSSSGETTTITTATTLTVTIGLLALFAFLL